MILIEGSIGCQQFTKTVFPKFQRGDVIAWILKCERFFELDETPNGMKVKMASMGLDDRAFKWHQAYEQLWEGEDPSWDKYVEALKVILDLHMRPSRKIQQGTLADFNDEFDAISCKLHVSEDYHVDAYLTGLQEEYAGPVRLLKPRTMREVRSLARMLEITL